MEVIAAYLLAVLDGNTSPSTDDMKDILDFVGAEANDGRISLLLSEVKGKDIAEVIAIGREKLASVPASGGGAAAPEAAEAKKMEKVEQKEEFDDGMGFSLFD